MSLGLGMYMVYYASECTGLYEDFSLLRLKPLYNDVSDFLWNHNLDFNSSQGHKHKAETIRVIRCQIKPVVFLPVQYTWCVCFISFSLSLSLLPHSLSHSLFLSFLSPPFSFSLPVQVSLKPVNDHSHPITDSTFKLHDRDGFYFLLCRASYTGPPLTLSQTSFSWNLLHIQ